MSGQSKTHAHVVTLGSTSVLSRVSSRIALFFCLWMDASLGLCHGCVLESVRNSLVQECGEVGDAAEGEIRGLVRLYEVSPFRQK